jgi:hypothetical protein
MLALCFASAQGVSLQRVALLSRSYKNKAWPLVKYTWYEHVHIFSFELNRLHRLFVIQDERRVLFAQAQLRFNLMYTNASPAINFFDVTKVLHPVVRRCLRGCPREPRSCIKLQFFVQVYG